MDASGVEAIFFMFLASATACVRLEVGVTSGVAADDDVAIAGVAGATGTLGVMDFVRDIDGRRIMSDMALAAGLSCESSA